MSNCYARLTEATEVCLTTAPNRAARSSRKTDCAHRLQTPTNIGRCNRRALVHRRRSGPPGNGAGNCGAGRTTGLFGDLRQHDRRSCRPAFGQAGPPFPPCDPDRVHLTIGGSASIDTVARLGRHHQGCMGRPARMGLIARDHGCYGSAVLSQSIGRRPATGWTGSARRPAAWTRRLCASVPVIPWPAPCTRECRALPHASVPCWTNPADMEALPIVGKVRGRKLTTWLSASGSVMPARAIGLMVRAIRHLNVMFPPL